MILLNRFLDSRPDLECIRPEFGTVVFPKMKTGSVLVDVAIDQGGCAETSKPTTHQDPTYVVDGVVHYCVANMPGACARTATMALTNATLPYVIAIASKGYRQALLADEGLKAGLSTYLGVLTCADVAQDLELSYQLADVAFQDANNDQAAVSV